MTALEDDCIDMTYMTDDSDEQTFNEQRRLTSSIDEQIAKSDEQRLTSRDRCAEIHKQRLMQAKSCS